MVSLKDELAGAIALGSKNDEYRLLVYPIVLGKGERLFHNGTTARLKLSETRAFDTGVVLLRYEPLRGSKQGSTSVYICSLHGRNARIPYADFSHNLEKLLHER